MKVYYYHDKSLWVSIGPYLGRIQWDSRCLGFASRKDDGFFVRFIRRWWSGFERIEERNF